MAEMMVAIAVMGIGLLMVATTFPIAWTRARDLAEFTNHTTAAHSAEATVRMVCRVSNPIGSAPLHLTSFVGDVDPGQGITDSDSRVHVLHVDNVLSKENAAGEIVWSEQLFSYDVDGTAFILVDSDVKNWQDDGATPPLAQVSLHDRMIPQLPPRPDPMAEPLEKVDRWDDMLAGRRFAWSVLYKLEPPLPTDGSETRSITMYFVTLRRTQPTHRFARQQGGLTATLSPRAQPRAEDMRLPVPWLVNLKVLGAWGESGETIPPEDYRLGIPTEAVANPDADPNGRLIAQMLQPGSMLIDRRTGNVFSVKQHRFSGSGGDYDYTASVTLDREINEEDLGLAQGDTVLINEPPTSADFDKSDLRDFWVFPPPISRAGGDEQYPIFDGKQPVVAIETRQMIFTP